MPRTVRRSPLADGSTPAQNAGEGGANRRRPAGSDPRHGLQAAIVGRRFQRFQIVQLQLVVDELRQLRPDARHYLKQLHRVERAAQALQPTPAPGRRDFVDRLGDALADAGQTEQAVQPLPLHQIAHVFLQMRHGVRRPAVGIDSEGIRALLFQQIGRLPQWLGDLAIGFDDRVVHSVRSGKGIFTSTH